jgi:ubiquinone/menaquinone biosynthesis C-methylase UbiE
VLSGAQTYVALDAVPFSSTHLDNRIVEEIYTLLLKNCPIPGDDEFPKVNPRLERYDFPIDILSISRQSLESNKKKLQSSIRYVAPMTNATALPDGSVDYLFSQAVMEHVSDIRDIYSNCYRVLKMGGIMSHSIDFKSHGKSTAWNGHWQYPAWLWRIVVGKRPFLINRQPLSSHLKVIEECGFEVLEVIPVIKKNSILRHRLASEFKNLNVRDLTTAGVFIIASKR